jgi:uncharacterized protein (DUF433 family)
MSVLLQTEAPPLRIEPTGAIRVGQTRVLLELVIQEHQKGRTPEQIVSSFTTLKLPDVYSVIGYYLRHPTEIDAYLAQREAEAGQVRSEIETAQGSQIGFRDELIARKHSRE